MGRRRAFGRYLWRIFPSPLPDQEAKRRCISILSVPRSPVGAWTSSSTSPPRTWGVGYPTHVYDAAGSLTLTSPVFRLRLRKTRGDAEQLGAEQEPSRGTAGRRAWRRVSSVTVVRGRNVDVSLAWISCRARTKTRRMASEITEVLGDRENDGAASAARPSDFDDSQTARVSGAADPLLRTSTAPRLCQKQTTNMVDAEDRFKAGTL
ncbi:hypothetical protein B0H13DRAFT_2012516 [Mycena leptocephala]|nr:hypothetical protein B0H13DRAFT_2012516 [Mycena leptocephala]